MADVTLVDSKQSDEAAADSRLAVFISYSRRDAPFVQQLAQALTDNGYLADFDRSQRDPSNVAFGIAAEDEWWPRLQQMIAAADVMVFVVSPDSAASKVCDDEIEYARAVGKRIIAILHRPIDFAAAPKLLAALNVKIDFSEQGRTPWSDALAALRAALDVNVQWVREHTRIGTLALEWDKGAASLLRDEPLAAAERWISQRPRHAPEPTALQRRFILAGREAEQARIAAERVRLAHTKRLQTRAFWALSAVTLLMLAGLAGTAWQARETAKREAIVLSSAANKSRENGYPDRAVRAALLGLPKAGALPWLSPWSNELGSQMGSSVIASRNQVSTFNIGDDSAPVWSPAKRLFLTMSSPSTGGIARLWDGDTGAQIAVLPHNLGRADASFSTDGRRLVIRSVHQNRVAQLWDTERAVLIATLTHDAQIKEMAFSPDSRRLLTRFFAGGVARLWDAQNGGEIALLRHDGDIEDARFSPDGQRIALESKDGRLSLWNAGDGGAVVSVWQEGATAKAALSQDWRRIATYAKNTVTIWDDRGAQIHTLTCKGDLRSIRMSPDGSRLATVADETRLWDVEGGADLGLLGQGFSAEAHFSPDGRRLVVSGLAEAASLKLLDGQTGAEIAVLTPGEWPDTIAFSADGKRLLAHNKSVLGTWDAEQGQQLGTVRQRDWFETVQVSPDLRRIVLTASQGNNVWLWDGESEEASRLAGGSPVFSSDYRRLVTHQDKTAILWDVESRHDMHDLQRGAVKLAELRHDDTVYGAHFSHDGGRLLTTTSSGVARLWDGQRGAEASLTPFWTVHDAKLSPDRRWIVGSAGGEEGPSTMTAVIWDRSGQAKSAHIQGVYDLEGVQFSADGARIALSIMRKVELWNRDLTVKIADLPLEYSANSMALSADGKKVLTTGPGGAAHLWRAEDGGVIAALPHAADANVEDAEFSADGTRALTRAGNLVMLWDANDGTEIAKLDHGDTVSMADFSADGRRLWTAAAGKDIQIWDAERGTKVSALAGERGTVLAISADAGRVLTVGSEADEGRVAKLWDGARGTSVREFHHESKVRKAAISPDGRRIVTVEEKAARLWDPETSNAVSVLLHFGEISSVALTNDGKRIVTASNDTTVRLWDGELGNEVAVIAHEDNVWSAAFSRDGKEVLTQTTKIARVWDVDMLVHDSNGRLRDRVCAERLNGTRIITAGDADDPILRERMGADVCAPGPLTVAYWKRVGSAGVEAVINSLSVNAPMSQ